MEDKRQMSTKITEIPPTVALSDMENREFAEKYDDIYLIWEKIQLVYHNEAIHSRHRQRGNEYFKCADFAQALTEYTMSVGYLKTVAALNNRALTCKSLT